MAKVTDDPVVQRIYKIPCYKIAMVKDGAVSVEQKRIGGT